MLVYATDNQLKGLEDRVTALEDQTATNAPEIGVKFGYLHKLVAETGNGTTYSIYVRMTTATAYGEVSIAESTEEAIVAWQSNIYGHMIRPICYYEGFQPGEYWGEVQMLSNLCFNAVDSGTGVRTSIISANKADWTAQKWSPRFMAVKVTDVLVQ